MQDTTAVTEQKMTSTSSQGGAQASGEFSPISDLLKSSWERFKLSWKNQLILGVILWVIFFGMGILLGGVFLASFGVSMTMESMTGGALASALGVSVIVFIVAMVVGSVFGTAMMLAAGEAERKPGVGELISRGFKLFFPVLLTSLIVTFLSAGGTFLLIIPGIVIAILTGLSVYEVVFTENRYLAAVKNGVKIVSQNFWELFVRVLLLIAIFIGLFIVEAILTALVGGQESAGAGAVSLLSGIVQMVISWFTISYYYQIYTEARARTDFNKSASMLWMWIVAVLGWIASIFIFSAAAAALSNLSDRYGSYDYDYDSSMEMQQFIDPSGDVDMEMMLEEYGQDMSAEEREAFESMMQRAEEAMEQDRMEAENEGTL